MAFFLQVCIFPPDMYFSCSLYNPGKALTPYVLYDLYVLCVLYLLRASAGQLPPVT